MRKYKSEIKIKNCLVTEKNRKVLEEILEKKDISFNVYNYTLYYIVQNFEKFDISQISQKIMLKKVKQYFDTKEIGKKIFGDIPKHFIGFKENIDGLYNMEIRKYNFMLHNKTKNEVKNNNGEILDFLGIRSEDELYKLKEYINY